MAEIHRIQEQDKAPWFKDLKAAIDKVGYPSSTFRAEDELRDLIAKDAEAQDALRVAEKGTSDRLGCYITDAGKECGRALWFSYTNTEQTDPPDHHAQLLFRLGHAIEDVYGTLYEKAGYKVEREVPVSFIRDGVKISGRIDFLINTEDGPIELKSTQAEKFKWIVARKEAGRAEHRCQLNLYLHYLNNELLWKHDSGRLRYVITDAQKGTPSVLEFKVDYDPDQAEADLARLVRLWHMAVAKVDPGIPAPFIKNWTDKKELPLWPCCWCSYRGHCKDDLAKRGAA